MTADGKLIQGRGKAYDSGTGGYDSGREAHYWGGKRLMTADGGLFVCVSNFFSFYESDSFIF